MQDNADAECRTMQDSAGVEYRTVSVMRQERCRAKEKEPLALEPRAG